MCEGDVACVARRAPRLKRSQIAHAMCAPAVTQTRCTASPRSPGSPNSTTRCCRCPAATGAVATVPASRKSIATVPADGRCRWPARPQQRRHNRDEASRDHDPIAQPPAESLPQPWPPDRAPPPESDSCQRADPAAIPVMDRP